MIKLVLIEEDGITLTRDKRWRKSKSKKAIIAALYDLKSQVQAQGTIIYRQTADIQKRIDALEKRFDEVSKKK